MKKEIFKYYKRLIIKGLYFQAHEYLENYWRKFKKNTKEYYFFKIFIQLAALLHKIKKQKNLKGATKIIKNLYKNIHNFINFSFIIIISNLN